MKSLGHFKNEVRQLRAAYQRARYGWAAWDIIGPGFDQTHAFYIGNSLIALADVLHGAPAGYPNSSWNGTTDYKAWESDLRKHGAALILVKDMDNYNNAEDQKKIHEDGRLALHWVANHYMNLWD